VLLLQQQQQLMAQMQQPHLQQLLPVPLQYQQQQQHAAVVTMSQPREQLQQDLDTAKLLTAATDAAAAQRFTRAAAIQNYMLLQLPQQLRHLQYNAVHIQLPGQPSQYTDWPTDTSNSSSSSRTGAFQSSDQLAFHNHEPSKTRHQQSSSLRAVRV
jgi:hypothetical protein